MLALRCRSAALSTPDDAIRQWVYTGILINEITRLIVEVYQRVAVSNLSNYYSDNPLIPPHPHPKKTPVDV